MTLECLYIAQPMVHEQYEGYLVPPQDQGIQRRQGGGDTTQPAVAN